MYNCWYNNLTSSPDETSIFNILFLLVEEKKLKQDEPNDEESDDSLTGDDVHSDGDDIDAAEESECKMMTAIVC